MTTTVRPNVYLNFWKKYDADVKSMMLNQNAEELEAADRFDILAELPDFTNKTVVDVGAGIGRFTSFFARTAKHVVATDFIDSFIEKNKERNANYDNVSYQVNDASGLELESDSVDLLFTNWLFMYLSDAETVEFLSNSLRWLKPGGFIHLRESCTESSTGAKSSNGSLHQTENPTHYRHASTYLQLLRELRWRDSGGNSWRFEVRWAHSVPTYVEKLLNWRQVHWLAEKTSALEGSGVEDVDALVLTTHVLQNHTDFFLDNKSTWTDAVFENSIQSLRPFVAGSTILTYSPRKISPFVYVDPHRLAKTSGLNVWAVETNPLFYSASLSRCNQERDPRVRYAWNKDLNQTIDYWKPKSAQFEAFFATELLISSGERSLQNLKAILSVGAHLFLIEPAVSLKEFEAKHAMSIGSYFRLVSVSEVSEEVQQCQRKQRFNSAAIWLLVHLVN